MERRGMMAQTGKQIHFLTCIFFIFTLFFFFSLSFFLPIFFGKEGKKTSLSKCCITSHSTFRYKKKTTTTTTTVAGVAHQKCMGLRLQFRVCGLSFNATFHSVTAIIIIIIIIIIIVIIIFSLSFCLWLSLCPQQGPCFPCLLSLVNGTFWYAEFRGMQQRQLYMYMQQQQY